MFDINPTPIDGCVEIISHSYEDSRGSFTKIFHQEVFSNHRLENNFVEQYYSVSKYGVIRGMHFQAPPDDCAKLVYCTHGRVFDVILDLRKNSRTYLNAHSLYLDAASSKMIYIPKGLAHGFCSIQESSTLIYNVTALHAPKSDLGILWSSVNVSWPVEKPIISSRDMSFPTLQEFSSPFES